MTDFLSGLVDRALGRAPVLQRRRPALFERPLEAPAPGTPPGGFSVVDTETERESSHPTHTCQTPAPLQSARPAPPHVGEDRLQDASLVPSRRDTIPPAPRVVKAPNQDAPVRNAETETVTRRVEVVEQTVKRTVTEPSVPARPPARPPVSAADPREREPLSARPVVPPTQATATHSRQPDAEPRSRKIGRNEAPQAITPPVRPTPPAPVLPRPPLASRQIPVPQAQAPQEPVIHVTIGKIEVRAVPAAGTPGLPTRRADAAGPKLKLADYLRERSGGHS